MASPADIIRVEAPRNIGREISLVIDELVTAAVAFHAGNARAGKKHLRLAQALLDSTAGTA